MAWSLLFSLILFREFLPGNCYTSYNQWTFIRQDAHPNIEPLTSTKTSTLNNCLISCQTNRKCWSVAFQTPNHCKLFDVQFEPDDPMMEKWVNSTYYGVYDEGNNEFLDIDTEGIRKYKIVKETLSFADANKYCADRLKNGALACILDDQTEMEIKSFLRSSKAPPEWLWVGMYAPQKPGAAHLNHTSEEFTKCTDGTDLPSESKWWRPGQPNNWLHQFVGVQIIALKDDVQFGRWYDEDASKPYPFLCQYDGENGVFY